MFNLQRHLISRPTHRQFRTAAYNAWSDVTAAIEKNETPAVRLLFARSLTCQCPQLPLAL
jgi:hypothetical protein